MTLIIASTFKQSYELTHMALMATYSATKMSGSAPGFSSFSSCWMGAKSCRGSQERWERTRENQGEAQRVTEKLVLTKKPTCLVRSISSVSFVTISNGFKVPQPTLGTMYHWIAPDEWPMLAEDSNEPMHDCQQYAGTIVWDDPCNARSHKDAPKLTVTEFYCQTLHDSAFGIRSYRNVSVLKII